MKWLPILLCAVALALSGCDDDDGDDPALDTAPDTQQEDAADADTAPDVPEDTAPMDTEPQDLAIDSTPEVDTAVDTAVDSADLADEGDVPCDFPTEDEIGGATSFQNGQRGCDNTMLAPDPGEEGHLCAARLTPPSYPFVVEGIGYWLGQGAAGSVNCTGGLAHEATLFVATDELPPSEPTVVATLSVPDAPVDPMWEEYGRAIAEELSEPITLEQGEHLFLAIPLVGTHPDVMCIPVDIGAQNAADRNYWSNAPDAPYTWTELSTFGLSGSIIVRAWGQSL